MEQKYPAWVDEYATAMHQAFAGMVLAHWNSMNFFELAEHLQGIFILNLHEAILRVREKKTSIRDLAHSFSCPSSIRACLFWVLLEYQHCKNHDVVRAQTREVVDFLHSLLEEWCTEDVFGRQKTMVHQKMDIETLLSALPWRAADPSVARELGRLYASGSALVYALFKDFFPQDALEVYGPYDVSNAHGEGALLLIKHFAKIKPVSLWPQIADFPYQDIRLYQIYRGIRFTSELIGMHSRYEGDVVHGLVKYVVEVDGKYITEPDEIMCVRKVLEERAFRESALYEHMTHDEWKQKNLEWYANEFEGLFSNAGMDWRPTKEIQERLKEKRISMGLEIMTFPDKATYMSDPAFEVYWLKDLYT